MTARHWLDVDYHGTRYAVRGDLPYLPLGEDPDGVVDACAPARWASRVVDALLVAAFVVALVVALVAVLGTAVVLVGRWA